VETPLQGSGRIPIVGPGSLYRPFVFLPLFTEVPRRGILRSSQRSLIWGMHCGPLGNTISSLLSRAPLTSLRGTARLFSCSAPPPCPKPSSTAVPAVAHNTRRYEHPLADGPGRSGWGDADFHPVVNFAFTEFCELERLQPAAHGSLVGQILRREASLQVALLSRDDHERHQRHRQREGCQ
jgi:hypothetical protein